MFFDWSSSLAQWSYLQAAAIVIGGVVWSYFQTPSSRQATYAPVILIGFGMSIMYVMALAFITELIGENKVCVNPCCSASCLAYFVEGSVKSWRCGLLLFLDLLREWGCTAED